MVTRGTLLSGDLTVGITDTHMADASLSHQPTNMKELLYLVYDYRHPSSH